MFDADVDLSEEGVKQAYVASEILDSYIKSNEIDLSRSRFWTSPYIRAKRTATIINQKIKIQELFEDPNLVEQDFGIWDGRDYSQWEKIAPLEYLEYQKRKDTVNGKFFAKPPNGESARDVYTRVATFIETIMRDKNKGIDTIFIACHGITMRAFAMRFLHKDLQWYYDTKNPANCEIWHICKGLNNRYELKVLK